MMDRHLTCIELAPKDAYASWTESQDSNACNQPVHRLRCLARLRKQNRISMLSQVAPMFSQTLIMRVCRTALLNKLLDQGRHRCIQMGGYLPVSPCLPFSTLCPYSSLFREDRRGRITKRS